jgi:hypothetical protein
VPDRDAGRQPHDRWQLAAGGAGEDSDLDPERGQPLAALDDVDVHAAGVAGAGLLERGGVDGQDGDAARVGPRSGAERGTRAPPVAGRSAPSDQQSPCGAHFPP